MSRFALIITFFLLLLSATTGFAEPASEPFTIITSPELREKINRKEPGLVIIDTRSSEEFDEAHIDKAVNIPWSNLQEYRELLNFPLDATLVFYCTGST